MAFELVLIATAIHMLVWEKLPEWGSWFNRLLGLLPRPLQTLYDQWHCPFCAGFWIALAVHGLTGLWTIPALAALPPFLGAAGPVVGWGLDALASAVLIYAAIIGLKAIGLPAMKAELMKEEFMRAKFGSPEPEPVG